METLVITAGSYDIFHYGHYRLLKKCAAIGDKLILLLSTDKFGKIKGKNHYYNYSQREKMIKEIPECVDIIIPEKSWKTKYDIVKKYNKKYNVVFVMGDDWKNKFNDLPCQVLYFPRTKGVSTTMIRRMLNEHTNSN